MTIAPPLKDLYPMPDAGLVLEKAAGEAPVIVYQPFMGEEQQNRLAEGTINFDISFAKGQTSREYELFQKLYAHHKAIGLGKDVFWGLVSSKFGQKSPTPFPHFLAEAKKAQSEGYDCYAYNPMLANCAIYVNVWEQGRMGHPNIDPILVYMQNRGFPITSPQTTRSFFLCNYMCGNEKFWSGYFDFCEPILADLEDHARRGTDLGKAYGGTANYSASPDLTMRPFVIERFLGVYLQQAEKQGLKVAVYNPTREDFLYKFGHNLTNFFYPLYQRKMAMAEAYEAGDNTLFNAWHALRGAVFKNPVLAWHSDDPPPWVMLESA